MTTTQERDESPIDIQTILLDGTGPHPTVCPTCDRQSTCSGLDDWRRLRILSKFLEVIEQRLRRNSDLFTVYPVVKRLTHGLDLPPGKRTAVRQYLAKMIVQAMNDIEAVEWDSIHRLHCGPNMSKIYSLDTSTVDRLRDHIDHLAQSFDAQAVCTRQKRCPHQRTRSRTSEDTHFMPIVPVLPAPVSPLDPVAISQPSQSSEATQIQAAEPEDTEPFQAHSTTSEDPAVPTLAKSQPSASEKFSTPEAPERFSDMTPALSLPVPFYVFEKHVQIVTRIIDMLAEMISQETQFEDRLKAIERKVSELQIMLSNQGADR